MPNSETKNFSQNVSSSYHLEDKNKNVPKLRFKVSDKSWQKKRLDKICEINPINDKLPEEFYYIDLECVENGEITRKLKRISKDIAPSRAQRLLKLNDMLYQTVRPYQKNNFLFDKDNDLPTVASTGYAQIRSGKNNIKYIYQMLHTDNFVIETMKRSTGTGYPAISSSDLAEIEVYYPEIEEQKKISDFLSLIDKRIEKQRRFVELLKKYKRGLLSAIFSQKLRFKDNNGNDYPIWKTVTIKDTLNYEQPQKYIVKTENYSNEYSIPVLTANKAFVLGYINEVEGVYDKGDTIIYDDFTMDFKFVNFKFKVKSSAIKILTTKDNYSLYFMFNLLTRLNLKPQGHQRSYLSILEPMKILCPSFDEQEKIASFLYNIDKNIDQKIKYLNKLEFTKKGLLQQMFI